MAHRLPNYRSPGTLSPDAGKSQTEANLSGLALGGLEALTEFLPSKALKEIAKGSVPLYKELLHFAATELPGENITSIAQIVDDYRLGLRDDVTVGDVLEAIRDTTAATVVGGGAQLSVGGMLRAARSRANARAEERAKGGGNGQPQPPIPDVPPPQMPPVAESATTPEPQSRRTSQGRPYVPPGVQPGDVRVPEGPDQVRDAGAAAKAPEVPATPAPGERVAFDPALFDVVEAAPEAPRGTPGVGQQATQQPTSDLDTRVSPVAPAGTAGLGGATEPASAPRRPIAELAAEPDVVEISERLISFVRHAIAAGPGPRGDIVVGEVRKSKREQVLKETGVDIGRSFEIVPANTVQHVANEHPDITAEDWSRLPAVVKHFDYVALMKPEPGDQGQRLAFALIEPNEGYSYVAEVLTGKRKGERLRVVTYFKDHPNSIRNYMRQKAARKSEGGGPPDASVLPFGPQSLTSETVSGPLPPSGTSLPPPVSGEQVTGAAQPDHSIDNDLLIRHEYVFMRHT